MIYNKIINTKNEILSDFIKKEEFLKIEKQINFF
jgi:hypothetical protein